MTVHAELQTPDGTVVRLAPGDIVGRMPNAALCLNYPTISEAHAMVSLRGMQLKLLALRGRMSVAGRPCTDTVLRPDLRILLAGRVPLLIGAVSLPSEVLGIAGARLAPTVLGAVSSLRLIGPIGPELLHGHLPDPDAVLWQSGTTVWVQVGEARTALTRGDKFQVGPHTFEVVSLPLNTIDLAATDAPLLDDEPLQISFRYDSVHITAGQRRAVVDGIPARIMCELWSIRVPIDWSEVAKEIWGREDVPLPILRERWDSGLARLRRKLREARLRTDLVRATHSGQVEIYLAPSDRAEDLM